MLGRVLEAPEIARRTGWLRPRCFTGLDCEPAVQAFGWPRSTRRRPSDVPTQTADRPATPPVTEFPSPTAIA